MLKTPLFSVVSPVYRGEESVGPLVDRVRAVLEKITPEFEIILVDDRSPDASWARISECVALDPRVRGLRLSRNFGQHYAITAGLDACAGEWVCVLDCDLQDLPEEIPRLYARALEGFEVVVGRRTDRVDGFTRRVVSYGFYRLLEALSGTHQDPAIANFGLYHRKVIQAVLAMREKIRFFPTMVAWVGFRRATVDVAHGQRVFGESSYNYRKLLELGLDIILSYSDRPLRFIIRVGLAISVLSSLMVIRVVQLYFLGRITVLGYTSLIVTFWFFSGLTISMLGVLGLYLGKIFDSVKGRPLYLVDERVGESEL